MDDVMTCEPWSNAACLGYTIMALENLGYKDKQIRLITAEMKELLDWISAEDAQEHYYDSSY